MKNFGFAIWIGDPSESDAKRQAFRPQPMGLCLQGRPRHPNGADSNNSGLAVPASVLRLWPPGFAPFAPSFHAQG